MASFPFSVGPSALRVAIETNLTGPAGSHQSPSVTLEVATSKSRSYLVTFPGDLGNVPMMVGYGDNGASAVSVAEAVQGSVQVYY